MSFPQALQRQQAAIFARLGEDATWEGVTGTVRVRRRESDEDVRMGFTDAVVTGRVIMVRKSEVSAPAEGQAVQVLDDAGAPLVDGAFVVTGEPMLNRRGVWRCQVRTA